MRTGKLLLPILLILAGLTSPDAGFAADTPNPFAGLQLRGIGPAATSGRIADLAFVPGRSHEYFAAVASGGLWKTTNAGTTWTPVFENQGAYAVGVVRIHPANPLEMWVGTGENKAQRSVAYGDGVYRSIDGGRTWKNMGLRDSGHIGDIAFDPQDPRVIYVAAQGPLWSKGGDRGLYRSADGGESWTRILDIDPYTGVNNILIDPRNPSNLIVSSYQRHRQVWTMIDGGPGSAIYKSTDGGANWRKITAGLPGDHMGRIGLAAAPSNPDMVYAVIEAMPAERGVYRSGDFGENWSKRSDRNSSAPMYYHELKVDPRAADTVYLLDTVTAVSDDGGRSWTGLSAQNKHVDDHALWIDPQDSGHLVIGSDGGIYESWDRGQVWRHVSSLPVTQFYRVTPDNDWPFYNVYGGTQDNNTVSAPSRTTTAQGIANSDWKMILGGDGFKAQIDPTDPDTVYAQSQYGNLVRFDRRSGESLFITPQPAADEPALRWNWNSPLLISPHNPQRLYYGAQKLFRSDDRGGSWRAISGDLSRGLDRNKLEVMERVWSVDAIAKNASTSLYGSLIAVDESPLQEGLIYTGTDDGLVSVTADSGGSWRRIERISGVPEGTYVSDVLASRHGAGVAYATFDNHKRGDFKPYLMRTDDRGRSWTSIAADLPARGSVHTIVEDHVDPQLLFVGTEFGLFFTQDGGRHWVQMRAGLPAIAVRDLEIQRRENDLVIATFGRGIYILDDYTPLRFPAAEVAASEAMLFPMKDAWLYIPDNMASGSLGAAHFTASNPPFGAVITYYLKEGPQTRARQRRQEEQRIEKEGGDTPYPDWEALRAEDREESPQIILTITDGDGAVVRRISVPTQSGLNRVAWDLRLHDTDPVRAGQGGGQGRGSSGPLVVPGEYNVSLARRVDGVLTQLTGPLSFTVKALNLGADVAADPRTLHEFQVSTARLQRAVSGARRAASEMNERITLLKQGLFVTPAATEAQNRNLREIEERLADLLITLEGDQTISSRNEAAPMSIQQRVGSIQRGYRASRAEVTPTYRDAYRIAAEQFTAVLAGLKRIEAELVAFERQAEQALVPWTPGRLPEWQPE